MQWEILVAVILAIGIYTTILEVRAKRMAGKKGSKNAEIEHLSAKGSFKKQDK